MTGHDWRLCSTALAAWLASACWLTAPPRSVAVLATVVAIVALLMRRPAVILPLVVLAALAATTAWRMHAIEASRLAGLAHDHRLTTFVATVSRDAHAIDQHTSVVGLRVSRVESITAFVPHAVTTEPMVAGERWIVSARLQPPDSSGEAALATVIRARPGSDPAPWWRVAQRVREGVRSSSDGGSGHLLVPALVVGDTTLIDRATEADFRRSGLTHLMAVSGTNLTIVLTAVLACGGFVGVGRRGRLVLAGLAIVAFVLVARPEPSVLRAAVMGGVGAIALGVGRRGGVRSLNVVVIALLFLDPWLARSAGFVLSVCATGGIIVFADPLARRLQSWLPRWLALALAVPTAAQLACTPALAALSGEISMVAVLANLLAAPAVAPATVLGLVGGVLDSAGLNAVARVPGFLASECAGWILWVGHWCGGLAGAGIVAPGAWWLLIPALPLVAYAGWRVARRPLVVTGLALGLAVAVVHPPQAGWPPHGWLMVACDIGQGDATVLALDRPGEAMVVDTGPDDQLIHACLQRLRISRVRLLVLTHGDADHAAAVAGVARGRRIDQVLLGPGGGRPPAAVPVHEAAAGETFAVGGLSARTIWPPAGRRFDATNAACIVLSVVIRGVRILLTCDIAPESQRAILRSGEDLRTDVLKFPHHGSKYQEPAFIGATHARLATISSGAGNDYGHPTREALAMLQADGIPWWRTDQHGDIAVVLSDGRLSVVTQH